MNRDYPKVTISEAGEKWLDNGQMWMYKNNVEKLDESIENGALVDIVTTDDRYMGTGFLSKNSHITVRILSKDKNDIFDRAFFKDRIRFAYDFRKTLEGRNITNCRLIFGEADQLPGLTVDRYNDILVSQISSYGLEQRKDMLYDVLLEVLRENGQKTGYFLDQKANRVLLREMAHGKRVMDCFSHTGGFALNAAYGNASQVVAVDVSQTALDQAYENARLNHLENRISFVKADVFKYLDACEEGQFDIIVLDPPAFTKSRRTIDHAYSGYKRINKKAMKLLGRGGYLITCSCSRFMEIDNFEKMLRESAQETGVTLKQVSVTQQNHDHPILWTMEETSYLKFYIFQIV